jgi:hypothetical protein
MRRFLWVFLALLLLPAGAQSSDRDTLQGATSVQVILRIISGDTLPEGWPEQVGASVRARLTSHGLSVVLPDDLKSDQIQLQLTISAVAAPDRTVLYCVVSEEAVQLVSLLRDGRHVHPAPTWSSHKILILREPGGSEQLHRAVSLLVEEFCQDFLSVNGTL